MPFQKGQSGNPGGRKKTPVDVLSLARARTKKNLEVLSYWADQKDDGQVAVRAAIALHEIAWGKPVQPVEAAFQGTVTVRFARTPERMEEILAGRS